MRTISFTPEAFEQYNQWRKDNKKIQDKIAELISETLRNPYSGIGKPEPLKHQYKGFWSKRIDDEHRLIYEVTELAIHIISCKYHYPK